VIGEPRHEGTWADAVTTANAHNEALTSLVAELVAAAMAGSLDRMDLAAKRLRTHVNTRDE